MALSLSATACSVSNFFGSFKLRKSQLRISDPFLSFTAVSCLSCKWMNCRQKCYPPKIQFALHGAEWIIYWANCLSIACLSTWSDILDYLDGWQGKLNKLCSISFCGVIILKVVKILDLPAPCSLSCESVLRENDSAWQSICSIGLLVTLSLLIFVFGVLNTAVCMCDCR